jgi:hypothetical protein
MPIHYGQFARVLEITQKVKVPLRAIHHKGKLRLERYQIQRRGLIVRMLKPKRVRS